MFPGFYTLSNASNHPAPQFKNQHPAWVFTSLFSPRLCILRGVNSRGVGVRGSTVVHGYRMCLDGKAVWLPSVRVARSSPTFSFLSSDPLLSFDALSHYFLFCVHIPLQHQHVDRAFKTEMSRNTWVLFYLSVEWFEMNWINWKIGQGASLKINIQQL